MRLTFLIIFCGSFLITNSGIQQLKQETTPAAIRPGWKIYVDIRGTLQEKKDFIDYDTLVQIYQTMVHTQHEIPHMNRLLMSLINKTNNNPRVDQMILICAAKTLGSSKFPVPDTYGIFKAILSKDDRLTEWVLAYVAEAIGDYPVDIPGGNNLVGLVETKLSMVVSATNPENEYFGCHFLPPPKGEYIRSYIAGLQSRAMRSRERRAYYTLVASGHTELDIEWALKSHQSNGILKNEDHPTAPMKYLVQNPDQIIK